MRGKCEMCKSRIEKATMSVRGVSSADWDVKKQKLRVEFDPSVTSLDKISKSIARVGHDTDKNKADDKVYEALPPCCHYR